MGKIIPNLAKLVNSSTLSCKEMKTYTKENFDMAVHISGQADEARKLNSTRSTPGYSTFAG